MDFMKWLRHKKENGTENWERDISDVLLQLSAGFAEPTHNLRDFARETMKKVANISKYRAFKVTTACRAMFVHYIKENCKGIGEFDDFVDYCRGTVFLESNVTDAILQTTIEDKDKNKWEIRTIDAGEDALIAINPKWSCDTNNSPFCIKHNCDSHQRMIIEWGDNCYMTFVSDQGEKSIEAYVTIKDMIKSNHTPMILDVAQEMSCYKCAESVKVKGKEVSVIANDTPPFYEKTFLSDLEWCWNGGNDFEMDKKFYQRFKPLIDEIVERKGSKIEYNESKGRFMIPCPEPCD